MLLQLIEQGQTAGILLSGGVVPVTGCTYFPRTAEIDPVTGDYLPVEESAEVILSGTQVQIRATVNAIEQFLRLARVRSQAMEGLRSYVEYRPVDSEAQQRSELLGGRVEWSDNPGLRRLGATTPKVKITVIWLRVAAWEGAEVEVRMGSLANSGAGVGGRPITNCYDANRGNYLDVPGAAVTGVLPTPAKVLLTNSSAGAKNYRNFYLANNWEASPGLWHHTLEGESATSGGTVVNQATICSGGKYLSGTFVGESQGIWLPLSASLLQKTAGRRYKLMARFVGYSSASPIYVRPIVREAEGVQDVPGGRGEIALLPASTTEWVDLGAIGLPPGGYNTGWAAHTLFLSIRSATNAIVNLDFIQVTALDSWRHVVQPGMQIAVGDGVLDDGILGQAYSVESGAYHAIVAPRGKPLMLYPGKAQRITINHDQGSTYDVTSALTVRMWYRPRRVTV